MTISETITIQASTPPSDLPHDTAATEIARLPSYLSGVHTRDDGTDYIVTEAAYKDAAGNAGRVYIALNAETNVIEAIQSKVGGVWTNWLVGTTSIADDAVTEAKVLDKAVTPAKLADSLPGVALAYNGTSRALDVQVDGTTIGVSGGALYAINSALTTSTHSEVLTLDPAFTSQSLGSILEADFPAAINIVVASLKVQRVDAEVGATCTAALECYAHNTDGYDIPISVNRVTMVGTTEYLLAVNAYVATGGIDYVWFYLNWESDNIACDLTGAGGVAVMHGLTVGSP